MVRANNEECIVKIHSVAMAPCFALRHLNQCVRTLEELAIGQHHVRRSFVKKDAAMLLLPKTLQCRAGLPHAIDFQCGMFAVEAHAVRRFA